MITIFIISALLLDGVKIYEIDYQAILVVLGLDFLNFALSFGLLKLIL